jgi:hypothetical protein
MKSFGGKRGVWGGGGEWGKRICGSGGRRRIHPIQKGKQGWWWWWCCVIPISLSFVLSVEEEDERRKKIWKEKFIKLLSLLLLQEGITTFAKREIKPQHTQNPKEAKLEKPSTIPPFSQESFGIIVGFLFSSSKSFLLLLFVAA